MAVRRAELREALDNLLRITSHVPRLVPRGTMASSFSFAEQLSQARQLFKRFLQRRWVALIRKTLSPFMRVAFMTSARRSWSSSLAGTPVRHR